MTKSIAKRVKAQIAAKKGCDQCDFENALHPSRATWLCPNCGKDISLEYLFWYRAVHPEKFEGEIKDYQK